MIPAPTTRVRSPGFSRRGKLRHHQPAHSLPTDSGPTPSKPRTRNSWAFFAATTTLLLAPAATAELTLPDKPISDPAELKQFLDKQPYEIGFHAINLGTGNKLDRFGDRPVCLASTVKVFCLTELFRQKHEDGLKLSDHLEVPNHGEISLQAAADLMIGKSDNDATNALAEFLGRKKVNAIPKALGIKTLSREVLPGPPGLREVLDKRITGKRAARPGLPQHGTAQGMVEFYRLLAANKVLSKEVNEDLLAFFKQHPKPFTTNHRTEYAFLGKGGNILWTRPPKHYSMMGWALLLKAAQGDDIALCVWGEWFPEDMPPGEQMRFLKFVTDCVIDCCGG